MKRRDVLKAVGAGLAAIPLPAFGDPGFCAELRKGERILTRQTIFKVPEDIHRVRRVLLDGKEVEGCIYANTDLGRTDGKGFVKYFSDPPVIDGNNTIRIDCAKGHVEVELYTQLEIEGFA